METLELTNPTEPVMDISTTTNVALRAMEQSQHLERWKLKLRECEVQRKAYKTLERHYTLSSWANVHQQWRNVYPVTIVIKMLRQIRMDWDY